MKPLEVTEGKYAGSARSIQFADFGDHKGFSNWDHVGIIAEQHPSHEGHFGVNLRMRSSQECVSVCSVEHAEALIEALRFAIDNDFLFTNKQLEEHITTATDTRTTIKRKIRAGKD